MQKNYNILLADDDPDDRELFIEALAAMPVHVTTAINGQALLNHLHDTMHQEVPDCIFLDLNMPLKGGKECLQEIRNNVELKEIPVVIYSTSANPKDIEDTFALGANLYVIKSSSYGTLKKNLESIVLLDWQEFTPMSSRKNFVYSLQ